MPTPVFPWAVVHSYYPGVTPRLILAGLLLAQLADAVSFAVGVQRLGIGVESNPLASALYEMGGLQAVMLAKGMAVMVAVLVLAAVAERFPRVLWMTGVTGTGIGLLGATTNVLTIAFFA